MATNEFLKFDESDTNMLDLAAYTADLMRQDGFPFGSKPPSNLTNRFYRDTAGFVYAFGEFMKAQGLNASPDDLAALIDNIPLAVGASAIPQATNSAGTDAYVLTLPGITAYNDGQIVKMRTSVANTGAATLNINTLGAKAIIKYSEGVAAALITGDIIANSIILLMYSSSANSFVLQNPGGKVNADTLDTYHASLTAVSGTIPVYNGSAKLVGSITGDSATVDGFNFRNTTGILEYSTDGVVWNPVGTPIVNASANVKHIWATDRAAASHQVVKVMQLMPTFSGQVRITAEIAASAGTGLLRFPVANATSSAAALPAKVAHEDVALGTVVQNASSLLVDQITILSSAGALYTLVTSTLEVQAGVPIVGVIHNITAGATTNIRNITMAYDIISNSVQQTV